VNKQQAFRAGRKVGGRVTLLALYALACGCAPDPTLPPPTHCECTEELDVCWAACPANEAPSYNQASSCEASCRGVYQACLRSAESQ